MATIRLYSNNQNAEEDDGEIEDDKEDEDDGEDKIDNNKEV